MIDLSNKKNAYQSGGMHMDIVIDGKKVAHTEDVVVFDGEKNMIDLAERFNGTHGWTDKGPGVKGESDLDYEVKQVPGTSKLKITIKNPNKAIPRTSTYKVLGFGSHWPDTYQPTDNTIHIV